MNSTSTQNTVPNQLPNQLHDGRIVQLLGINDGLLKIQELWTEPNAAHASLLDHGKQWKLNAPTLEEFRQRLSEQSGFQLDGDGSANRYITVTVLEINNQARSTQLGVDTTGHFVYRYSLSVVPHGPNAISKGRLQYHNYWGFQGMERPEDALDLEFNAPNDPSAKRIIEQKFKPEDPRPIDVRQIEDFRR